MNNPPINCKCNQDFTESDFIKHYGICSEFKSYFKQFDNKFGELLKNYSEEPKNMFIIRILLNQYICIVEKKLKQKFNVTFNNNIDEIHNLNNKINSLNNNINPEADINNNNLNIVNNNENIENNNSNNFDYNNLDNRKNNNFINNVQNDVDLECCPGCSDLNIMYLECLHKICNNCFLKLAEKDVNNIKCLTCNEKIPDYFTQQVIGNDKYSQLEQLSIEKKFLKDTVACPNSNCNERILFEKGNVNLNEKDDNGKIMSRNYCESFANQRCRCPSCKKEFCVDCQQIPYHKGKTCNEHKNYLCSVRCKYDDTIITHKNKGPVENVCNNEECRDNYLKSCKQFLNCGHSCLGHANENNCIIGCIDKNCNEYNDKFNQNKDEFCVICYTEVLEASPCIKLDCGHIFHYKCIEQRIKKGYIGPAISLKFMNCPSCNQWMSAKNNKDIQDLIEPYNKLLNTLIKITKERIKFEGLDKHDRLKDPNDIYYNNPMKYGFDKILYCMCYKCKKPYFTGLKDCMQPPNERDHDPNDLICGKCGALDGVAGINSCKKHGKEFIEYKCKFCCKVSSWFCWGTTHFCDECHARQCKGDYVTKIPRDKLPICPGKDKCGLKIYHPNNGEEFALGCSICRNEADNQKDF